MFFPLKNTLFRLFLRSLVISVLNGALFAHRGAVAASFAAWAGPQGPHGIPRAALMASMEFSGRFLQSLQMHLPLLGARASLLGAPGLTTRSKKLLGENTAIGP